MSATVMNPVATTPHPFFDFNDVPDRIERRHDKDELRSRLLDQLETVLTYLFPRGKRQGSRFVVGNVQGDAGDSLVIELEGPKRGVWIDFATGESGDVLALWAAVRGFAVPRDFGELLDDVGDWPTVTADGLYELNGQRFKSLSAAARHITGTQWSGPKFFGLKPDKGGKR